MDVEWAAIAGDFPKANATAIKAMSNWEDLRYITDWYRLVLLYSYGGVWIDIDTVMLHDTRPIFDLPSMAYRCGFEILMNNAFLKIHRRPEAISQHILAAAIEKQVCIPLSSLHLRKLLSEAVDAKPNESMQSVDTSPHNMHILTTGSPARGYLVHPDGSNRFWTTHGRVQTHGVL